jgi:predicted DNA-binding protein YlxM (UPF0122 family)
VREGVCQAGHHQNLDRMASVLNAHSEVLKLQRKQERLTIYDKLKEIQVSHMTRSIYGEIWDLK